MKKITFLLGFVGLFAYSSQAQQISSFPHTEDFETFSTCGTTCVASCPLANGWTNQGINNWLPDVSGTGSVNTGPTANGGADHNPGVAGGMYLYTEASGCTGPYELVSPAIDLTGTNAIQFEFWCHVFGADIGMGHVDVSNDGGVSWTNDVIPAWTDNSDIWQMKSVDLAAYTGDTVNVRIRHVGATSFGADFAIDDVRIYDLIPLDIGISAIDSPSVPACNLGNDVWVTMSNYGSNVVNTGSIQWSVNGTAQAPFSYVGNMASNTDTTLFIGTSTVPIVPGVTIKAWTALPNGVLEMSAGNQNDTMSTTPILGLNGMFTIGGTAPDYPTIDSARADLETYGVCGPTTFNIRPGTYNEQVVFGTVANTSATNTVTFKSETGNKNDVIWTTNTATAAMRGTINLNGVEHFNFMHLTVENNSPSYGAAVGFENSNNWNTFAHNNLLGDSTPTSTSLNGSVIYTPTGAIQNHNTFDDNIIYGGSYGMYFYGSSQTSLSDHNVITNNEFINQYYTGARFYYTDNLTVSNNIFITNSMSTGLSYGLYCYYSDNSLVITNNRITTSTANGTKYPLYIGNADATQANPGLIANNMVIAGDSSVSSTIYGMYLINSGYQNVINNSILINSTGTNARAFYGTGGGGNILLNNNFTNYGAGYGMYLISNFTVAHSDHNNIFAPNATLAYYNGAARNTLADLQAQGTDLNSWNVNPMYYSNTDLHTCTDSLDGKGVPHPLVMNDVDGNPRNPNTPDIGADEFISFTNYSLGSDVVACAGDTVPLFAGGTPNDQVSWTTGDTTNTIWVHSPGTYSATINSSCGSGTDAIAVTFETLTPSFTNTPSFLTGIFTNTSTGTLGNTTYHWDFGDGDTSIVENPIHVYSAAGTYSVILTITSDCGTQSVTIDITVSTVGMDEIVVGGTFEMFPNPTTNNMNIKVQLTDNGDATLRITDITGRTVQSQNFGTVATGTTTLPVDVSQLNAGTYFVVLTIDNQVFTQKLSVLK